MFPSFSSDIEASRQVLRSFPENLREAIGLSLENFFTLLGFYSYLFNYILLAGSIQAMNMGLGLLSKERRNKTEDFLLTKPVRRSLILTSKIGAGLTAIVITNLFFVVSTLLFATLIVDQNFSTTIYFLVSFTLFLVQLFFFFFGILLSTVIPKIKSVISISLPVVFGFFIFSLFGSVIGENIYRYTTPFKFYSTQFIINNARYEMQYLYLEIILLIFFILASYVLYTRKDIP
jgi:ABC-2 type transport system permease protein